MSSSTSVLRWVASVLLGALAAGLFALSVVGGHPHPAATGHLRGLDAEFGAHVDQHALDAAHVRDDVDRVGQPHDRIADELAGPVPGDLAPAVDVDDGSAVERPLEGLGATTRGVDGLVLEQQHGVRRVAGDDVGVDSALQVPAGRVVDRGDAEADFPHVENGGRHGVIVGRRRATRVERLVVGRFRGPNTATMATRGWGARQGWPAAPRWASTASAVRRPDTIVPWIDDVSRWSPATNSPSPRSTD